MSETIKAQFDSDDGARQSFLDRAVVSAVLTKPATLPDNDRIKGDDEVLRRPWQGLGNRGIENLISKMIIALFPAGIPWFRHKLSSDQTPVDEQADREIKSLFNQHDRKIVSKMESVKYRTQMRRIIRDLLVVGNFLFWVQDDFRIKVFRIDNWVVRRTGDGSVMYTIAREKVDVFGLSDQDLKTAEINLSEVDETSADDRLKDIYTRSMWMPREKTWRVEQEINTHVIKGVNEEVNPFISGGLEDTGQDYFEGFVDQIKPDLRSLNGIQLARNQIVAALAELLVVNDPRSGIRSAVLKNHKQGDVVSGRVEPDGRVRGVSMLQSEKARDLGAVLSAGSQIREDLVRVMLMEVEQQPTGDRVTATQVIRIARQLEQGVGGIYTAAADQIQEPYLNRVKHLMVKQGKLDDIKQDQSEVLIMTGIAALSRDAELQLILETIQIITNTLGEAAISRLDVPSIMKLIFELRGLDAEELTLSEEEIQQAVAQQMQAGLREKAGEQVIETAGKVAQNQSNRPQQAA